MQTLNKSVHEQVYWELFYEWENNINSDWADETSSQEDWDLVMTLYPENRPGTVFELINANL